MDPTGTFVLEARSGAAVAGAGAEAEAGTGAAVIDRFHRLFICTSWMKHLWSHLRRVMSADATHSSSPVEFGVFGIATVHDAENCPHVVALAVFDGENKANWLWFRRTCDARPIGEEEDLFFVTDKDKGGSAAFGELAHMHVAWCIYHAASSFSSASRGKMPFIPTAALKQLAMAPNVDAYRSVEKRLLDHVPSASQASRMKEWLDLNRASFATAYAGWSQPRYGQYTSNGTEQINGAVRGVRFLPILTAVMGIMDIAAKKVAVSLSNFEKRAENGFPISMWALNETNRLAASGVKSGWAVERVSLHEKEGKKIVHVRVSLTPRGSNRPTVRMNVDFSPDVADGTGLVCTCSYSTELGRPCLHAAVVFRHIHGDEMDDTPLRRFLREKLTMKNMSFFNRIFWLEEGVKMFGAVPLVPTGEGLEERPLLPPLSPVKTKGRKKKRFTRSEQKKQKMKVYEEQFEAYLLSLDKLPMNEDDGESSEGGSEDMDGADSVEDEK